MRIELRDESRSRVGRIDVDPALRPTRVSVVASDREVFLNWDIAVDDAGNLRRCVACECTDLFHEKAFPQVTGLVVVLAFSGAVLGALGLASRPAVLIPMALVLVLDVAILLFSRRRLVCYRCRTSYHGLPIARYHRPWDRGAADRYPAPRSTPEVVPRERDPAPARPRSGAARAVRAVTATARRARGSLR